MVGRDVTETAMDLSFVTSLVIMRNDGTHVASVTQMTPAAALADHRNLNVTGFIAG